MNSKLSWVCSTFVLVAAYTVAAPLPDTGQTKCYDAGGDVITCPSPGEGFYGQDANHTINPMSYTKLDNSGTDLPDSATSWVMVRDNVTGLIWEMKTNKDGVTNYDDPHDADNTYTWYDSNPATNGGNAGTPGDGTDTEDFIKALNDANFGGNSDWRLPAPEELSYIVHYDIADPGPVIDARYFPGIVDSSYWSSVTRAFNGEHAGIVDFWGAGTGYGEKRARTYVLAVRGGRAAPFGNSMIGSLKFVGGEFLQEASTSVGPYTANGDGTVTDSATGLMWQQGTVDNTLTWEQALSHCENSTLADYTDWRLPTQKELTSLLDQSRYKPAINITYFPDTGGFACCDPWFYWSSTTTRRPWISYYLDRAWGADFLHGFAYNSVKGDHSYVRAVRGGQSELLDHLFILSPSQADVWYIGSQKTIVWETRSIPGDVTIALSLDGGKTYTTITDTEPNDGSYLWTVTGPDTVNAMIRIEPNDDPSKGTIQGLFSVGQRPYGGQLWSVPGTIEAENYDLGREGVAYHDTTAGNSGGQYRADDVDIWYAGYPSVGNYVGATATGEWLEYSVDVDTAAQYNLAFTVATPNSGRKLHVELDGVNVIDAITLPNTGSYSVWQTVTSTANLSAGEHVLRVAIDLGGPNFNRIDISRANDSQTVATPIITPDGGEFTGSVTVSVSTTTSGATIYYSTNNTTPTTSSNRYTQPFTLSTRGVHVVRAFAVAAGYNDSAVNSVNGVFFVVRQRTNDQKPFGGELWSLPGTLEAENFDLGPNGVAYHDTTPGNSGRQYRTDDVDIWYASDATVGNYVGTANREWLEYSVDVATAGRYSLVFSVATPNSGRKVHVEMDGVNVSGAITLPNTGSYSVWQTVTSTADLSAGQHVLRVAVESGGFNFNRIDIN